MSPCSATSDLILAQTATFTLLPVAWPDKDASRVRIRLLAKMPMTMKSTTGRKVANKEPVFSGFGWECTMKSSSSGDHGKSSGSSVHASLPDETTNFIISARVACSVMPVIFDHSRGVCWLVVPETCGYGHSRG